MVNSITQAIKVQTVPNASPVTGPKTTKTSIFYLNDTHANLKNIEKLKTASDSFDIQTSSEKVDKLKLSAGDFNLGVAKSNANYAIFAQNSLGIMANAAGNHEFDLVKKDLVEVLKDNPKYKLLGLNINIPETSTENKAIKNGITKSYIQEVNGTKYGVIGLLPFDFALHATHPQEYNDFDVYSIDKTIPLLQNEIDNLKNQGLNKIIVLSHAGYESDMKLAQSVEGIDIILGGHTHNQIEGIEEGKNLFYSQKTGEPTIITQAGKDGRYFGVLNLEFNEKGIITSAQNNVNKTEDFQRSPVMKFFTDKFFGKPVIVGEIKSVENHGNFLITENPTADFINDAVRKELNVDISIINSGNMREKFEQGKLTDRDIKAMTPFKNEMGIVSLNEKEIVDALKVGAKSIADTDGMPGLLQVSGLKYVATKSGEIKEVNFIDKTGKQISIDVNNPNTFKTYKVAADAYLTRGGNGYLPDKSQVLEQKFDFDKDKLVIDFVKKQKEPFVIKTDGRITVVD